MRRRDFSFTLALCLSLAAHGWVVSEMARQYAQANRLVLLPGWAQPESPGPEHPDDRLGERTGTGNALDDSPGLEALEARKEDQTQAFASLDPEGFGAMRANPSVSVLPQGGRVMPPQPESADPAEPASFGVPSPAIDAATTGNLLTKSGAQSQTESSSNQSSSPSQASNATTPGVPMTSANPAPQAETESDPVSEEGGVRFRNGRTVAQFGRKHKLTYPRLSLAAETSLIQMRPPVLVVLRIRIDSAGNVLSAEIDKSSGSNDIDHPCRIAAYSWWFEPSTPPVKEETFLFTLRFS